MIIYLCVLNITYSQTVEDVKDFIKNEGDKILDLPNDNVIRKQAYDKLYAQCLARFGGNKDLLFNVIESIKKGDKHDKYNDELMRICERLLFNAIKECDYEYMLNKLKPANSKEINWQYLGYFKNNELQKAAKSNPNPMLKLLITELDKSQRSNVMRFAELISEAGIRDALPILRDYRQRIYDEERKKIEIKYNETKIGLTVPEKHLLIENEYKEYLKNEEYNLQGLDMHLFRLGDDSTINKYGKFIIDKIYDNMDGDIIEICKTYPCKKIMSFLMHWIDNKNAPVNRSEKCVLFLQGRLCDVAVRFAHCFMGKTGKVGDFWIQVKDSEIAEVKKWWESVKDTEEYK